MSEWRTATLDQVLKLQRGHDLPTGQRRSGKVPVVGAAGPSGLHDTAIGKAPGVVVGRAGASMGHATYCDVDFWPLNTSLYVTDFMGNEPRFVYYLLHLIDFSGYNSGAAQPMLNRNYIKHIPILLPPPREQRAIMAVIGVLDDKIAIDERIAATAEGLVLALASGERWQDRVPLEEICQLRKDQVSPREITEGLVDHYSLPAFDAANMPERVSPEVIKSGKFAVAESAVLLSKLNPEIPRAWNIAPDPRVPSLASTEFLVLTPRGSVTTHELWAVTRQQPFLDDLAAKATGTSKSHQRVRPAEVMAAEVVDPRKFGETGAQIQSLCRRAALARQESKSLTALRDTLLPQLMSGRLRVKDAEKIVEDAT